MMKRSIAGVLVCFVLFAWKADNDPTAERKKLLNMVGAMLEQKHYLTPVINDAFSREVWNTYINAIDIRKCIFLQADIDQLKAYQNYLDNEMHGDSLKFFPEITQLYAKRYEETAVIYQQLLSKPFTFSKKDSIGMEVTGFPKDQSERVNRWRNYLKRITLEKMIELQENNPGKKDAQLEQMAREIILKQHERMLARFRSFNEDKLFTGYVNVITHYVDPHSDYFPPLDKKAFDQSMANRFFGIGAQLKDVDGTVTIAGVDAGSPSWKSGQLAVNDQIVKVGQGTDGAMTDVVGMGLSDVVQLIRGDKGTTVRIGCRKTDGRLITVPLVREEIKPEETLARSAVIWKDGKKTGYIYLPVFYDDFTHADGAHCADDVAKEVTKLKAENVNSIIIDLRNNGGGSLTQVIKMLGLFIGKGPVVQVRMGPDQGQVLKSDQPEALYSGPLTVMVNELSASASEIFAAAIQDYGRGIIIGSTTFGKGTVQTTIPFTEEKYGAVKLTIQKFYRINGGSTQLKGVIPDIVLPDLYETLKIREGDKPSALGWDRISEADYKAKENKQVPVLAADPVFKVIADNNTWLETYLDKTSAGMPLPEYKAEFLKRRKIAKQNETIQQLEAGKKMDVRPVAKASGVSYEKWLERIAADIYIDQALKVAH
ncbi:tail-specific protease [Chitinophaga sp. SYP-B3965]|uniref:carboxy terminal-processing peptidase n=1 Tax=Chitinophaga sp. SYP-B3965 TaxID=2663120 RepID=UPI001299B67C|nr:carboxy terminal-processing peptidase [Chitinophaga sp. SYP-B3965]MRG47934.1 tail-specific protease [Chitinophaga sp. SYP-B3965]